MMSKRDYYEILGVERTATSAEIKRAYRRRARALHPDVNPSPKATEQFQELGTAYDTLSNPLQRSMYDRGPAGWPRGPVETPWSTTAAAAARQARSYAKSYARARRRARGSDQPARPSIRLGDVLGSFIRRPSVRIVLLLPVIAVIGLIAGGMTPGAVGWFAVGLVSLPILALLFLHEIDVAHGDVQGGLLGSLRTLAQAVGNLIGLALALFGVPILLITLGATNGSAILIIAGLGWAVVAIGIAQLVWSR